MGGWGSQYCDKYLTRRIQFKKKKKREKRERERAIGPTGNFGISRHASCAHFSSSSCPVLGSALQAQQRCVFKRWSRPVPWAL